MNIRLTKLELTNFKGIKSLSLDFQNKDADIFGANNSGKTTVADAFYWLLFNKNSLGQTKFDIKTLDKQGKEIHNLDHSVYGVLEIEGKEHHIKKTYREKWTKKRGQATASFTGHETDYELGSSEAELTPKKKKEFDEFIKSIISDENIFKLATNPLTFNALKQDEKKKILMSLVDEVTDESVIQSDNKLKDLNKLLGDGSIDDFKKRIARDKKAVNKELQAIPIRIDEINRNLPDIQKLNEQDLKAQLENLDKEKESVQKQIDDVKKGNNLLEIDKAIQKHELDLQFIIDNHGQDLKLQIKNKQSELDIEKRNISNKESNINSLKFGIEQKEKQFKQLGHTFNQLRQEDADLKAETKTFEIATVCDHCGQAIPEEMQQDAIRKMQDSYNLKKSERLSQIKEQAVSINQEGATLKKQKEQQEAELATLEQQIKVDESVIAALELEISELKGTQTDPKDTEKYKQVEEQLSKLKAERAERIQNTESDVQTLQQEKLLPITDARDEVLSQLNDIKQSKSQLERIKTLEGDQQKLAEQYEGLEHAEFLTDEFTKAKVNLIEDSINSKFKITKFKLFDTQINEGVTEVCEATHDGVPYSSGLNSAARLNVGLDIINALSEHYDFYAPIMIDNAESVTDILPTKAQQIRLQVSKDDKTLRLEA